MSLLKVLSKSSCVWETLESSVCSMALESHLCLPSGALLDHGAGHGTADGEALEKPSNRIAQTQGKEFLKKVNTIYQHMIAT